MAITALLAGCYFSISGGGIGHFSPDTLQSSAQRELFFLHCRAMAMPARYHQMPLVTYLIEKGYWKPQDAGNPHWTLSFEWQAGQHDGESRLHRELAWYHEAWIEWSDQHPEIAKELWPLVLHILRSPGRWPDPSYVAESVLDHGTRKFATLSDFHRRIAEVEAYFGPLK